MTGAAGGTQPPCADRRGVQDSAHAGKSFDAAVGTKVCAVATAANVNAIAMRLFMVGYIFKV